MIVQGKDKNINDFKSLFTNLARTSYYEVNFSGMPAPLTNFLRTKNISTQFRNFDFGLLCYSTSLPTSSFTTTESWGNYTGITERFASTKQYGLGQRVSMDFYVDRNYQSLILLESWMEFITSGSYGENSNLVNEVGYYNRLKYPNEYKIESAVITKFERDYKRAISYEYRGLFPVALNPITVSYDSEEILKVSAVFSIDRYIAGRTSRVDQIGGISNNRTFFGSRLF